MLLQRKPQNAKAVITANIEFIKLKKQFKQDRIVNKELTTEKKPIGLLNHMLLWQVYICKRREFKQYIKLLEHNNK